MQSIWTVTLRHGGPRQLQVVDGHSVLATIDTRTFAVTPGVSVRPRAARAVSPHRSPPGRHAHTAASSSSDLTWAALGIVAAFVVLAGVILAVRRRVAPVRRGAALR